MTVPVDPIAVALAVARVFEALGIQHTIGGSIASSFAGEPRSTVDIDFVAAMDESQIPALVNALSADFYVDDASLRRAIRARSSTNLIHHTTQLKVDIFVAGGTPLDQQQLQRRQEITPHLDRAYLVQQAPSLGVADLLTRVLEETSRA